jgi:hypothetical protein
MYVKSGGFESARLGSIPESGDVGGAVVRLDAGE